VGKVTLYFGPAGCGKTSRLVQRFAESVRSASGTELLFDPRPRFLYLVPDAQHALVVRQRMLGEEALPGLVAPSVTTFGQLYSLIFTALGKATPEALSDLERLFLLRRLLGELNREGALRLFGELASRPGFVRTLDGFIQELKQGEAEPFRFERALDRFGRDERSHDLLLVYKHYQKLLKDHGLYDAAGLSWQARDCLRDAGDAFSGLKLLVVDGFVTFTPTQLNILSQLAGWAEVTLLSLLYEKDPDRPELFHQTGRTFELLRRELQPELEPLRPESRGPATLAHIERNVFRWQAPTLREPVPAELCVLTAPGDWREALEVAREMKSLIRSGRYHPADILVVCRSTARCGTRLAHACRLLGVPLAVGEYRKLLQSPLVTTLLTALRLQLDGWPREAVAEVLASPYLMFGEAGDENAGELDVGALAARARIVGGKEQWSTRLGQYRRALEEAGGSRHQEERPLEDRERRRLRTQQELRACAQLERRFAELVRAVEALPERASLREFAGAVSTIIAGFGFRRSLSAPTAEEACRDLRALATLEEKVLERLAVLPAAADMTMTLEDFVAELTQALADVPLAEATGSSEAVRLLEVHEARGVRAPVVFVVGLLEGGFPRAAPTRTFYTDGERRRLKESELDLEQQEDTQRREMLLFYTAVTRATERLYLTYPATDSRGKEQLRSHFVDEVAELFEDAEGCRREVRLSDWPPAWEHTASAEEFLERWVVEAAAQRGRLSGEMEAGQSVLAESDPRRLKAVIEGAAQLRQREGNDRLDAFDGALTSPQARELLARKFDEAYVFSASQFDAYASCPFAFFLDYVVGLEPAEAPPERMEPVDAGSICHRVLARVHRRAAEAGRDVWEGVEESKAVLAEELRAAFDAELRMRLGLSGALAEVYRAELGEVLHHVLEAHPEEDAFAGLRPRHFELAFGLPPDGEADLASSVKPLRLELERGRVLIRGRIDRVDVAEDGSGGYGVLDYKAKGTAGAAEIRAGLHTQLAIYVAACRELFFPDGECQVAGFLSLYRSRLVRPIRREPVGKGQGSLTPEQALSYLRHYVSAYTSAMKRGLFPPAPSTDRACSYCAFAACCRRDRSRIERKLGEGGRDEFLGVTTPAEPVES